MTPKAAFSLITSSNPKGLAGGLNTFGYVDANHRVEAERAQLSLMRALEEAHIMRCYNYRPDAAQWACKLYLLDQEEQEGCFNGFYF